MARLRALVVVLAVAVVEVLGVWPARAGHAFCPYTVLAHYASVYARPSVYSTRYDAMPHGTQVFASASAIAGAGGPFRMLVTSAGTAYAQSATLTRVAGSCFAADALGG